MKSDYYRPGGAALDRFEAAKANNTDEFPHGVHVVIGDNGSIEEVWLNTESTDFDGLCIGTGVDAVADAVRTLERAIEILQGPPSPDVYRPREKASTKGQSRRQWESEEGAAK